MIWGSTGGLRWHWRPWRSWVCCVGLQFRIQPRSCRGRCGEWWPAGSGCGCLARPGLWFLCWPLVLCVPCAHCLGLCVGVCSTPLATAARHARTCAGCMRTGSKLRFADLRKATPGLRGARVHFLLSWRLVGHACLRRRMEWHPEAWCLQCVAQRIECNHCLRVARFL